MGKRAVPIQTPRGIRWVAPRTPTPTRVETIRRGGGGGRQEFKVLYKTAYDPATKRYVTRRVEVPAAEFEARKGEGYTVSPEQAKLVEETSKQEAAKAAVYQKQVDVRRAERESTLPVPARRLAQIEIARQEGVRMSPGFEKKVKGIEEEETKALFKRTPSWQAEAKVPTAPGFQPPVYAKYGKGELYVGGRKYEVDATVMKSGVRPKVDVTRKLDTPYYEDFMKGYKKPSKLITAKIEKEKRELEKGAKITRGTAIEQYRPTDKKYREPTGYESFFQKFKTMKFQDYKSIYDRVQADIAGATTKQVIPKKLLTTMKTAEEMPFPGGDKYAKRRYDAATATIFASRKTIERVRERPVGVYAEYQIFKRTGMLLGAVPKVAKVTGVTKVGKLVPKVYRKTAKTGAKVTLYGAVGAGVGYEVARQPTLGEKVYRAEEIAFQLGAMKGFKPKTRTSPYEIPKPTATSALRERISLREATRKMFGQKAARKRLTKAEMRKRSREQAYDPRIFQDKGEMGVRLRGKKLKKYEYVKERVIRKDQLGRITEVKDILIGRRGTLKTRGKVSGIGKPSQPKLSKQYPPGYTGQAVPRGKPDVAVAVLQPGKSLTLIGKQQKQLKSLIAQKTPKRKPMKRPERVLKYLEVSTLGKQQQLLTQKQPGLDKVPFMTRGTQRGGFRRGQKEKLMAKLRLKQITRPSGKIRSLKEMREDIAKYITPKLSKRGISLEEISKPTVKPKPIFFKKEIIPRPKKDIAVIRELARRESKSPFEGIGKAMARGRKKRKLAPPPFDDIVYKPMKQLPKKPSVYDLSKGEYKIELATSQKIKDALKTRQSYALRLNQDLGLRTDLKVKQDTKALLKAIQDQSIIPTEQTKTTVRVKLGVQQTVKQKQELALKRKQVQLQTTMFVPIRPPLPPPRDRTPSRPSRTPRVVQPRRPAPPVQPRLRTPKTRVPRVKIEKVPVPGVPIRFDFPERNYEYKRKPIAKAKRKQKKWIARYLPTLWGGLLPRVPAKQSLAEQIFTGVEARPEVKF